MITRNEMKSQSSTISFNYSVEEQSIFMVISIFPFLQGAIRHKLIIFIAFSTYKRNLAFFFPKLKRLTK